MSVRVVTATLLESSGAPMAGVPVRFSLNKIGIVVADGELYPPSVYETLTDANGTLGAGVGVELWANAEGDTATGYQCSINGGSAFRFQLPAGATPVDLSELRLAGLTTLTVDDPLILVIDARIAAAGPSGGAWGDITGDITDQADLTAFVQAEVDALVGAAPGTLDTLAEIATQLQTDEGALVTSLAAKADTSAVASAIAALSSVYQAISAKLSAFVALADGVGFLKNDGAGAFSYSAPTKSDVGLGNVDNTSDANAPVSTAQQTALDLKADSSSVAGKANLTANNFTGAQEFSAAGAINTPGVMITGAPSTAGTSATDKPQLLIEPTGTTAGTWENNGTMVGVNAPSGFNGNLFSLKLNGASNVFNVDSQGTLVTTSSATFGATITSGGNVVCAANSALSFSARSLITSPVNSNLRVSNAAGSDFGLLQFGGTTSSFPAIKRSGNAITLRTAADTIPTFATLPAASAANEGALAPVSDSSTATPGATVTGGGANHILAYSNGTVWKCVV